MLYLEFLYKQDTAVGTLTGNTVVLAKPANAGLYKTFVQGYKKYELTKTEKGTYELIDAEKNKYYFNTAGILTELTNKKGQSQIVNKINNQMTVTDKATGESFTAIYNNKNSITEISDNLGRTATFSYDSNNLLKSLTDLNGQTTAFEYDPKNRVSKISVAGKPVFIYEYDDEGRVIKEFDAKLIAKTYSYDTKSEYNRVIVTTKNRNGDTSISKVDFYGNIVYNKDPLGNETLYTYHGSGMLTSVTDANKNTTVYEYDDDENCATLITV